MPCMRGRKGGLEDRGGAGPHASLKSASTCSRSSGSRSARAVSGGAIPGDGGKQVAVAVVVVSVFDQKPNL